MSDEAGVEHDPLPPGVIIKEDEGLDLSWMTDPEAEHLAEMEKGLGDNVEIVSVGRETVDLGKGVKHLCPITIEIEYGPKDGHKTKLRLVREDELWQHAKTSHKSCLGRGYLIYMEKMLGSVAVEVTDLNLKTKFTEHRRRCPCAVVEIMKKDADVLPRPERWIRGRQPDFFYRAVKSDDAPERPPTEEEIVRELAVEEGKSTSREQYLARAQKFRDDASELEGKASALDVEIAEAGAGYETELARLRSVLDVELRPKRKTVGASADADAEKVKRAESQLEVLRSKMNGEIERLRKLLVQAESDSEKLISEEEDALAAARRTASTSAAAVEVEVARLDQQIASVEKEIDRLPIPSRVTRLKREKRVLLDKAERLRNKASQKETFAGSESRAS